MKAFLRVAVVLVGILGIATALIVLGRVDNESRPSANYSGPSGYSAFAALLEKRGFRVRADRTVEPRISDDELAIVVGLSNTAYSSYGPSESPANSTQEEMREYLTDMVVGGSVALITQVERQFSTASSRAAVVPLKIAGGDGPTLSVNVGVYREPDFSTAAKDPVPFWTDQSNAAVVKAHADGRGVTYTLTDGVGFTNRYIDQNDNARFAVTLVESLAPAKKVVFLEAAHGDIYTPGLLESIGRWLKYGWTQFLLLFVVVAYTLGRRFGLPVYDRFIQRGQRDLVDAIGFLFMRSRASASAMEAVLKNADRELRKSLKISYDAPKARLEEQLPSSLLHAIHTAETVASIKEAPPNEILNAAQRVEREVAEFIGSRTIIRPKSRRKAA